MIERRPWISHDLSTDALTVEEVALRLEAAPPEEILGWALERYRPRIALACSFGGPTGIAALDLVARIDPSTPVYYLDTGLLFAETLASIERISQRYGITPIAVAPPLTLAQQAERYGPSLWERDPDACCRMRKIEPQREFLSGFDAWISGIRRDQGSERARTPVVQWDANFGLVKVSPFARWTETQVWQYVRERGLEYNPLHDRGYPSIGCTTCTRAVSTGDDRRAGRWPGFTKTECGLHVSVLRGDVS